MKNKINLFLFILIACSSQFIFGQSKAKSTVKTAKRVSSQPKYNCLPEEIKLDTVVLANRKTKELKDGIRRETVKQRLNKLHAQCRAGKLVDNSNREIRFYQLQGCWGNPPQDYQDILDRQQRELAELKEKYTVIELTCNASGEMPF